MKLLCPKKPDAPTLGESRSQALQRFTSNERSLQRKGTWEMFQAVVQEYMDLGHAQLVTSEELATPVSECHAWGCHGEQLNHKASRRL